LTHLSVIQTRSKHQKKYWQHSNISPSYYKRSWLIQFTQSLQESSGGYKGSN